MASKYDRITDYLNEQSTHEIRPSLHEIDRLVGGLPPSAYKHPAWWSNESVGSHVQSQSWQRAGWVTSDLDLNTKRITFRRVGSPKPPT